MHACSPKNAHLVGDRMRVGQDAALLQRGDGEAARGALALGLHLPGLAEVGLGSGGEDLRGGVGFWRELSNGDWMGALSCMRWCCLPPHVARQQLHAGGGGGQCSD